MLTSKQKVLSLKHRPNFTRFPAHPFYNLCLGGIARPNAIYVPLHFRAIRDVDKEMGPSTLATVQTTVIEPPKIQKTKKTPKTPRYEKVPLIPIQKGGARQQKRRNQNELPTRKIKKISESKKDIHSQKEEKKKNAVDEEEEIGENQNKEEEDEPQEEEEDEDDTEPDEEDDEEDEEEDAEEEDLDSEGNEEEIEKKENENEKAIANALMHPMKVV